MDISFAGSSALEVIRMVRTNPSLELVPATDVDYHAFDDPHEDLRDINYCALGLATMPTTDHPAYIRATSPGKRRRSPNLRCLLFPKHVPPDSLMQLVTANPNSPAGDGNRPRSGAQSRSGSQPYATSQPRSSARPYAASQPRSSAQSHPSDRSYPADCLFDNRRVFVDCVPLACATIAANYQSLVGKGQMRPDDALVQLVELVMELAGSYSRNPADPYGGTVTENVAPAVSIADFRSFVLQQRFVRGCGLLARALCLARDGSRSPMETCLWIMLTLPESSSRYGLPGGCLNVQLTPTDSQRALMRHKTLTPDVLWQREHVAIEYQGDAEHSGRAARAEDARRMTDYQVCGIMAFFVSFEDVRTVRAFDELVRRVAMALSSRGCRDQELRIERLLQDPIARGNRARRLARLLPPVGK